MVAASEAFSCTTHNPLPVADRAGSAHCFNCIIETYQTPSYNLARRMLSDWSLAEYAVQESSVSGYRAFTQFRGDHLKSWIMRIVANTCRDMLRSRRARPVISLDPTPTDSEDPTPSAIDLASDDPSPEELAERSELRQAIEAGLNSLNEERRLALALVDVQGFSYEEAAQTMDCSLGTVKSRVSRGRSDLRDYLQGIGELLPAQFRQDK
jgi:RNA polymerase sigma-70 factor (ECF subfamily)